MDYDPEHAELYELVFNSRGKDFDAEADKHAQLILSRFPEAKSLLDVACGTGAHLAAFAKRFDHVEGVELTPAMRDVATTRLPRSAVHLGNMVNFDLGRTFDAVTCLGNAIGEVGSAEEVAATVARMAAHTVPGGVVIVEPWWFPELFIDGYIGSHLAEDDGRVVARVSHSTVHEGRSRIAFEAIVADSDGIRKFSSVLSVGLFTREEYESAFERAGCTVEFVPALQLGDGRATSPGIFVGVRQ
ncbi:bifunctional 2-polyprenyl-6-hydroxyphenol methylase/3-demethylubiquinol 3-O-methyltransferase UbiG [Amycolatopsis sp. YIM 10]|uniref:class I SAM-dependent methyltransferase n=1 Tax=Amycolatopsis sp. YIM 10 TaxID=2653857 RepID=UPI00128FFDAE|nr:class I SAM-dependent methyltransferase [Amycolatopsis sp. YIM 10]QFU86886.1 dTDP-3-amino-3,4,6-trideoxy-alpha-D-glucopyranose [Amycolatopsis sp. YIM 10]